ncbi:MAG: S-methyl-5-thioribose-1-phosphate isomerase [Chlorobiaceae bacterium]|nr:S-methyl-5-thioribose-1-phosphate isomerase [Chlorobiaceae bacterium]MBA4310591.1 S-methyl-5-thioribose-1-phosphate isomerase [Chlorobiaceae bacterium]
MIVNDYFSMKLLDEQLHFIDQTKLPIKEEYIRTDSYERIAVAIERLEIRGAPAIGVAAAYALALSTKNNFSENIFFTAYHRLISTRPTAVNLSWALNEIRNCFEQNRNSEKVYDLLIAKAVEINNSEFQACENIGENGLAIFMKKSKVLTHCNTGRLATAGEGTAFNVIKKGFNKNLVSFVYADETRPLFQGSRLTAFELEKNNIPYKVITDSTAAHLMKLGEIDLVITGADRIAANGDSANKIGTYNLAVLCSFHKIPFFIAAPFSTIDKKISSGNEIIIELRKSEELSMINRIELTSSKYEFLNYAFDVTPSELITGIITDEKIFSFPYNFNE